MLTILTYQLAQRRRGCFQVAKRSKRRCEMSWRVTSAESRCMPQQLAAKEGETLEVIKEDLCQWLTKVLKTPITPSTFFERLDTAVLLCKLARLIQDAAKILKSPAVKVPSQVVRCNEHASRESFAARDNASNFISWCRCLGVEEAVIFESEGLVLGKDEKRVILCLLDVGRFAERVGLPSPQLVQMEREIDEHDSKPHKKRMKGSDKGLEEKVMSKLKGCNCPRSASPEPLSVQACGNSKFVIRGGTIRSEKTLHARMLSDRIMVRVGGGWDTLDHFLLEHDPCRIKKFISDGDTGKVVVNMKPS